VAGLPDGVELSWNGHEDALGCCRPPAPHADRGSRADLGEHTPGSHRESRSRVLVAPRLASASSLTDFALGPSGSP
jgi:hypothetical protein